MTINHAGPRITHYGSNLLPHGGPVTVHGTFGAGCFAFLEGTPFQALPGIVEKLIAFRAQSVTVMVLATVELYHFLGGSVLSGYSGMITGHIVYLPATGYCGDTESVALVI